MGGIHMCWRHVHNWNFWLVNKRRNKTQTSFQGVFLSTIPTKNQQQLLPISNPRKSVKWVFCSTAFFRPRNVKPRSDPFEPKSEPQKMILWTKTKRFGFFSGRESRVCVCVCIFLHPGICFCITGVSPMQFLHSSFCEGGEILPLDPWHHHGHFGESLD